MNISGVSDSNFTENEIKKYVGNNTILKTNNPNILSWIENGEIKTIIKSDSSFMKDIAKKLGYQYIDLHE